MPKAVIQHTARSNEEGRFAATWKKKEKKFNTAVVSIISWPGHRLSLFAPGGALWAVSSTGNHSTAEPYRIRHISFILSHHPLSTDQLEQPLYLCINGIRVSAYFAQCCLLIMAVFSSVCCKCCLPASFL
jgi:hypothetical protein